jgi:hypothetical protein
MARLCDSRLARLGDLVGPALPYQALNFMDEEISPHSLSTGKLELEHMTWVTGEANQSILVPEQCATVWYGYLV